MREAEVFGVNHKFAVNADQYDVNNPNRHLLLNSMALQASGVAAGYRTTVPQPFNLSTSNVGKARYQAQYGHDVFENNVQTF